MAISWAAALVSAKDFTDGDSQIAEHTKVEPFHGITQSCGTDGALQHVVIDDSNIIDRQLFRLFFVPEMLLLFFRRVARHRVLKT